MTQESAAARPAGWPVPASWPGLAAGDVHVWLISLEAAASWQEGYALLSDEERRRADRFRKSASRADYIAAHAAMRQILGRYLNQPPGRVRLARDAAGKPVLEDNSPELSFNLSHSGPWAMLAVTPDRAVGCDIEVMRPEPPYEAGRMVFSAEEQRSLEAAPEAGRAARFYELWTCKEALLKAMGLGFAREPRGVAALPGRTVAPWWVSGLSGIAGSAAAVATWHRPGRLRCWRFAAEALS